MLKQLLQGLIVGLANIIPGVSGGTMLVAMGLYDKMIHAVTHLRKEFKQSMKLLLPILIGAGIAIVIVSFVLGFLFESYPIQTNLLFCGLIVGSLPVIVGKIKGVPVSIGKILAFVIFFAIVVGMALMGEASGSARDISLNVMEVVKLFGVGVVAAATMVVPGVSGSMMLILMGYYDVILNTISRCVKSLAAFDIPALLHDVGILIPFGIGVIVGIFAIAKIIEFIFQRAEVYAYCAIMGLIVASPIAILWKTDWSGFSIVSILTGAVTFAVGWVIARKLGE